jgi:hypothetical protein
LLRERGERLRGRCTAEQRDEIAPSHFFPPRQSRPQP